MIFKRKLRHVLVESTVEIDLMDKRVEDELKTHLRQFLGETDYFRTNPRVSAQLGRNVFIMSVNRGHERGVILALSFIKDLNKKKVGFYTIKTSGTIRTLKELSLKLYKQNA